MRKLNLIVVFSKKLDRVLFCIRAKEPYKGLYNFVGGKVEEANSKLEQMAKKIFEFYKEMSRDEQEETR